MSEQVNEGARVYFGAGRCSGHAQFNAPAPKVDAKGNIRLVKPWMVVRDTSVGLYAHLKDSGKLAEGRWLVLNAIAYLKNRRGYWPTGCEVLAWLFHTRQIEDLNPNHVKPRCSELADGWDHYVTVIDDHGVKTREKRTLYNFDGKNKPLVSDWLRDQVQRELLSQEAQ